MYSAQLQEQQLNEQAKLIAALTAKIDNLAANASTESTAAKPSDKAVRYVGGTNLPERTAPTEATIAGSTASYQPNWKNHVLRTPLLPPSCKTDLLNPLTRQLGTSEVQTCQRGLLRKTPQLVLSGQPQESTESSNSPVAAI